MTPVTLTGTANSDTIQINAGKWYVCKAWGTWGGGIFHLEEDVTGDGDWVPICDGGNPPSTMQLNTDSGIAFISSAIQLRGVATGVTSIEFFVRPEVR
jgi:hypothetical protein